MKLKLMGKNHSDELYTPKEALEVLIPYLNKDSTIWECALGTGKLAENLRELGFHVIGDNSDFLVSNQVESFDCIVTNPPYSIKDKFLQRAFEINKPFAFLMPITALEGIKRQKLFQKYHIQIIFPKKRIDFNGKKSPWFYTAWFCYKLNLPKDLLFNQEDEE